MSFDRRWLLTAAGSAFLASFAREGLGATPRSGPKLTGDPAKDEELLFAEFEAGYGSLTKAEEKVCHDALKNVYGERFARIHPGLDATKRQLLMGFAYGLGNLTYRCLENERKGACGWKADPAASLREEHVQRARELLGFHLNTKLKGRCGAAPATSKFLQADEACPLCPG